MALAFMLGFAAAAARADLWGYVDENGVAHFAPTQVDSRYRLFFKGRSSLDPPDVVPSPSPSPAEVLQNLALYRRVAGNPNVKRYEPLIEANAKTHGLEPALVKAMIAVESAFDPAAVSAKGAIGLMQVMPATGERYGVTADRWRTVPQKLLDPSINLRVGTRYLRDLLKRFDDDLALALAAYNAGEGAVESYENRIPPYPETQEYVKLVRQFQALYQPPPAPPAPNRPAKVTIDPRRPGE